MTNPFENIPNEPPREVERVADLSSGEKEKLGELAVMMKAQQLFETPRSEDDPYRTPDDVKEYAIVTEVMSFLRDKDGEDKRDRRTLVYRRLLDENGELINETQVVEYRESISTVEALITCNRYPDSEVPADILKRVEDFIDYHLDKTEARPSDERTDFL